MSQTVRQIPKFLAQDEIKSLLSDIAEISAKSAWTEGRQKTSYFKHSLRSSTIVDQSKYRKLIDKSLRCLLPSKIVNRSLGDFSQLQGLQIPSSLEWDCYLIRYPPGSSIPAHVDPLPEAKDASQTKKMIHRRLNAIIQPATSGGEFELNNTQKLNPELGDAIIFAPSHMSHSVSTIEGTERLVWSVGCVVDENDLDETFDVNHAFIIGAGEVGRRLEQALRNVGWSCEFVRRNDTEAWARAVDYEQDNQIYSGKIVLRILAMREEDLGAALKKFDRFPHRDRLVLVQNGFLESIIETKLKGTTRGLIYFTSKGDFFSQLTDSIFSGPYGQLLADSLNKGGILARHFSSESEFTQHMITKGIWNSLVGLPLHVHKTTLGEYVDAQEAEIKAIIEESLLVTSKKYELELQMDAGAVWKLFIDTTQHLRWMKRSGRAAGLEARNGAIQKWGKELGVPTPITDKLIEQNFRL